MMKKTKYCVFILTHGRPDRVYTLDSLTKYGYTGPTYLVVDDLDVTKDQYVEKYKDQVIVFDKKESANLFDVGDNLNTFKGVVYARNAVFDIADRLGYEYFIVLDDDYKQFRFRFNAKLDYGPKDIRNLDMVFELLVKFFIDSKIDCLACLQGGDFIGGDQGRYAQNIMAIRKLINLYVCSTKRRFEVMGRINEDVNLYTSLGSIGRLFLSINQIALEQVQTQSNAGGMTDLYLESGTYVKSFYSVLFQPASVKVAILKDRDNARLHHRVSWRHQTPKILRESVKHAVVG